MTHKYAVGQKVDLVHRLLQIPPTGQYEISRLMPDPEGDTGDPLYRIRSTHEAHQRVAQESDLRLSNIAGLSPEFSSGELVKVSSVGRSLPSRTAL